MPEAKAKPDDKAFTDALARHAKLTSDSRYASLPQEEKDALDTALRAAKSQNQTGSPASAVKTLDAAVAKAVKALVAAQTGSSDLDKLAGEVSGMIDGAQLTGTPPAHVDKLRATMNKIRATPPAKMSQALAAMATLRKSIETDPVVKAAKVAHDKVLEYKPKVEAAAAAALKVPVETPVVQACNRQLAAKLPRIGMHSGKLQFMEAAALLDECARLCSEIEREKPEIVECLKIKAEVEKRRAKIDKAVKDARLAFPVDDADKPPIESFRYVDKEFEGAMYRKDYRLAKSQLPELETRADMVQALKAKSDRKLQEKKDGLATLAEYRKVEKGVHSVASATKAIVDAKAACSTAADAYLDAYNAADWVAAVARLADYKAVAKTVDDAAAASAAELEKHREAVRKYSSQLKKDYVRIMAVQAVTDDMRKAQEAALAARNDLDAALGAKDYTLADTKADALKQALSDAAGHRKANAAAATEKANAEAAFRKNESAFRSWTNAPAFTDEYRAAQKSMRDNLDQFVARMAKGDTAAQENFQEMVRLTKVMSGLKADNAKARVEAVGKAQPKVRPGNQAYRDAIAIADAFSPHSDGLKAKLDETKQLFADAITNNHALVVIELSDELVALKAQVDSEKSQWEAAVAQIESDAKAAHATAKAAWDKVKGFHRVNDEIKALRSDGIAKAKAAANAEKAGGWQALHDRSAELAAAAAKLEAKRAEHDKLYADRKFVEQTKAANEQAVEDAELSWIHTDEARDAVTRLKTRKQQADDSSKANKHSDARAHWERILEILADWPDIKSRSDAARPPEWKPVREKLAAIKDEVTTAEEIRPITPEIKKAYKAYWDIRSRFKTAEWADDYETAAKLIDAYVKAAKALAALDGDFKAAEAGADKRTADAAAALDSTALDDLKKQPIDDRLKLLEELRASGRKLDAAQKKLQRKLYATLEYDEDFKKEDEKRRGALIDTLKADDEITGAKSGWAAKTDDEKLKVLIKVLNAECKIYDVPAPTVRLFCEPPGDEGYFSGGTMTLNLNTHPDSGWSDYKEAIDTVVHENMHNFQRVLERRLEEGILTPGSTEYRQAVIFTANFAGYVPPSEPIDPDEPVQKMYKQQPVEMHAWDTGDGVGKALNAYEKPKPGVQLQPKEDD